MKYEKAELEVVFFDFDDVVRTSSEGPIGPAKFEDENDSFDVVEESSESGDF